MRARLDICSVYVCDGSNYHQIGILDGDHDNQTGPWYVLNASDTECIWMHVETTSVGTSYVYAYLEIKGPNNSIYAR